MQQTMLNDLIDAIDIRIISVLHSAVLHRSSGSGVSKSCLTPSICLTHCRPC